MRFLSISSDGNLEGKTHGGRNWNQELSLKSADFRCLLDIR